MPRGLPTGSWKKHSSKLELRRQDPVTAVKTKPSIPLPPSRAKLPVLPPQAVALAAIGIFLRAMRESFGMTQDDLAARTEGNGQPVSRATISAIEKGKHSPTVVTVVALTTVLHVDPMEILDRIKIATAVPEEYRKWTVEQLDERSKDLFAERRFRETLTVLDTMMARLTATAADASEARKRRMAVVEVRRASTLRRLGAIVAAKWSAERAIGLANDQQDVMARAYMVLVAAHLRLGNLQLGIDAAERAVQVVPDGDAALAGEVLIERGRALLVACQYSDAFRAFTEAHDRAAEAGDEVHLITSTGNMGLCLSRMRKAGEAEARFRTAVELASKGRRPDLEARWLVEWGRIAFEKKRLEEASRHGQKALSIAQRGEYWSVAFSAAMLLHRVAKAIDPATEDRHRVAYLKKLRSWVEEDVADPDYREFVAEVTGPRVAPRGEA